MAQKICNPETENQKTDFYCEKCDYSCNKYFLFKQHLKTKKHNLEKCSKMLIENMQSIICSCGKKYKHIQSYNRHIKNCKDKINKTSELEKKEENELLRNMIGTLIEQNQNIILENKEMRNMVTNMIPKIGNNNYTINNKVNIQLFLDQNCKDALNLDEFVETLKLRVNDLDETRKSGYVSGITNIFVRELNQLDLHKRPIHCSDLKREILYIKNNNIWSKDDNEKQLMKGAITSVAKKQIDKISEWEKAHKDLEKNDLYTEEYLQLIKNATDEGNNIEREKHENKIIKSIAKEVLIDK